MMFLGVFFATVIPDFAANPVAALAQLFPSKTAYLWISFICTIFGLVLNLYGAFMSFMTTVEPFTYIKGTKKNRIIVIMVIYLIGSLIAVFSTQDFLAVYGKFIQIILFFIIPWTSINLVDFYFVRHGQYNWKTIGTYFLTILIQIPFINLNWYVGPISQALGGADIAWLVGGVLSAVLYYYINRKQSLESAKPLSH